MANKVDKALNVYELFDARFASKKQKGRTGEHNGKVYKVLLSDAFLKVMIAVGVLGLLAAGIGAASMAAQVGAPMGQLSQLNSLGNGAIAMMAVGGTLALAGGICLAILIKRLSEKTKKAEEFKQKAAEFKSQEDLRLQQTKARLESIEKLPKGLQQYAHKMTVGQYAIFQNMNQTFTVLYVNSAEYKVQENSPDLTDLKQIREFFNRSYKEAHFGN